MRVLACCDYVFQILYAGSVVAIDVPNRPDISEGKVVGSDSDDRFVFVDLC